VLDENAQGLQLQLRLHEDGPDQRGLQQKKRSNQGSML
jgi:hypothetical protein